MNSKVKPIVMTALFAAVTCILAIISIPIPFSPVPFTLSLLAVFLSGSFLSPVYAFISQLVYLLIGAVGVPVFSGFRGGLSVFLGPTGGFLFAYPFMALIVALFIKTAGRHMFLFPLLGMIMSLIVCYILGTVVFCISTDTDALSALSLTVFPFVAFDSLKAVIASSMHLALVKRLK